MSMCLLLAACGAIAAGRAAAQAEPPEHVHVQVAPAACPSGALLEQKLRPLLGAQTSLVVDGSPGASDERGTATVQDLGDAYLVEVGGVSRELPDPGRDCTERARVAAVFIALNLNPESIAPPEPEPEPELEPAAEPAPEAGAQFGVRLSAEAAYASALERGALGAGAGAWLDVGAFRFDAGAAALVGAEVELAARDGVNGTVALTRIPFALSAAYLWRAGAFAFGPALGVGFDVLLLRGEGLERAQSELRLNPGALAAADLHVALAGSLSALLRVALHAYPRAYALAVDPQGQLGRTPRLWLGASLGVAWSLR
jgi:hypothetical protein